MAGRPRSLILLLGLLACVACSAPAPTASPTVSHLLVTRPPWSPSPRPTRTPAPTPTPTVPPPTAAPHSAELVVTGEGSCRVMNYGGCWTVLLLDPSDSNSFRDWSPSSADLEFELEHGGSNIFEHKIVGPPPNAPRMLKAGRWEVGLGLGEVSDIAGEPAWGTVLCVREFEVSATTRRVELNALFQPRCRIDIVLDEVPVPVACDDQTFYWLGDAGRDRIDADLDRDHGVLTITVTSVSDPSYTETATVMVDDPTCVDHQRIGPIIRGALEGFDPPAGVRADLVGRLMVVEDRVDCSVLIDSTGLTWDISWPSDHTVSPEGLHGPDATIIAPNGALMGIKGRELERRSEFCLARTGYRASEIVFVEPPFTQ